jgi:hypothetical protein
MTTGCWTTGFCAAVCDVVCVVIAGADTVGEFVFAATRWVVGFGGGGLGGVTVRVVFAVDAD